MTNQFDADLQWNARELWAIDSRTNAVCLLTDTFEKVTEPWRWRIDHGEARLEGRARDQRSARAKVRRRLAKLPAAA